MVKLKSTSKTYAMKIIKKSIIDDEDDIEWVQTEKNVFEQASNHPFLVGFNHLILVHYTYLPNRPPFRRALYCTLLGRPCSSLIFSKSI